MSFFESGKKYRVRVVDLHSPDAQTFSVSVNDLTGRYPTNEDVIMPGELINALLDATVPHEIIKMEHGFPKVIGTKFRPRFSVTPVGMGTFPVQDATIITPGVSVSGDTAPDDSGAVPFDPFEGQAPGPETDTPEGLKVDRQTELENMRKGELIDIASDHGLEYSDRNNKSEIIAGILAAEASE